MGDRANVYIKEDSERGVYLYTHWSGSELAGTVQDALKRGQGRWSDGAYLARIIFCEMVKGNEQELTGFGISTGLCDNEHAIIVVDPETQTIGLAPEPTADAPIPAIDDTAKWTFSQFTALSTTKLEKAWDVDRRVAVRG